MTTHTDHQTFVLNPDQTVFQDPQGRILEGMANGETFQEISANCHLSAARIQGRELSAMRPMLNAKTNYQLVANAILHGILKPNWVATLCLALSLATVVQLTNTEQTEPFTRTAVRIHRRQREDYS